MSILDEIRAMSPEEQVELGKLLQSAEIRAKHQDEKVRQLGESMHGPGWDPRRGAYMHRSGITMDEFNRLSPPEQYVLEHPVPLRAYGYCERFASFGQPEKTKYWSRKEIDEYNEEQKLLWLEKAHKVFPNVNFTFSDDKVIKGDA